MTPGNGSLSLNRYLYVEANPIIHVDPTGHQCIGGRCPDDDQEDEPWELPLPPLPQPWRLPTPATPIPQTTGTPVPVATSIPIVEKSSVTEDVQPVPVPTPAVTPYPNRYREVKVEPHDAAGATLDIVGVVTGISPDPVSELVNVGSDVAAVYVSAHKLVELRCAGAPESEIKEAFIDFLLDVGGFAGPLGVVFDVWSLARFYGQYGQ